MLQGVYIKFVDFLGLLVKICRRISVGGGLSAVIVTVERSRTHPAVSSVNDDSR
jgi:hypothetical protein